MRITETSLKDAYIISCNRYEDERGFFMESFNKKQFEEVTNLKIDFVQDNHSKSFKNVLRGLHYQVNKPQGKIVRCLSGAVFDVIVDLRKSSPTFLKWFGIKLMTNNIQLWVPPGFAHGFYTLTETAEITYKTTDYYYPEFDRTLIWNDKKLNIEWGVGESLPLVSQKDSIGKSSDECDLYN